MNEAIVHDSKMIDHVDQTDDAQVNGFVASARDAGYNDQSARTSLEQSRYSHNILGRTVQFIASIQFARIIHAAKANKFEIAKRLLEQVFNDANQFQDGILYARCRFWKGWLYAELGQSFNACCCLLSSIAIAGRFHLETELLIRYFAEHYGAVCHAIDAISELGEDEAIRVKEYVLQMSKASPQDLDFTAIQDKDWYVGLNTSPVIRKLSDSYLPPSLPRSLSSQSKRGLLYTPASDMSRPPVHQTLSSILRGDSTGKSSWDADRTPSQTSQQGKPPSSLFRQLFDDIGGQVENYTGDNESIRSFGCDTEDQHSPPVEDQIDALMDELKLGRRSSKAPSSTRVTKAVSHDQKKISGINLSLAINGASTKVGETGRQSDLLPFSVQKSSNPSDNIHDHAYIFPLQSRSISRPTNLATRRSRRPLTLINGALRSPKVVRESEIEHSLLKSPFAESHFHIPVRPSLLRNGMNVEGE